MMNYEVAKRLEDAGFEFKTHLVCGDGIDTEDSFFEHKPTLSELIEACGEIHLWGPNQGSGWYADGGENTKQHGSTPEEAVANLWLALNEKKL